MPDLRKLAKEIEKSKECEAFLNELPHKYYDENMLHSVLLSGIKEYDTALTRVEAFLPFVDNWAACDTLSPKAFKKNRPALMEKIRVCELIKGE